jgi:hypothetical protein
LSSKGKQAAVLGTPWTEIAGAVIIALSGVAGALRASWLLVVGFALLFSLVRWEWLAGRAREVRAERQSSGLPWLNEAYATVLALSFLLHFILCALAYGVGRSFAWLFWKVMG